MVKYPSCRGLGGRRGDWQYGGFGKRTGATILKTVLRIAIGMGGTPVIRGARGTGPIESDDRPSWEEV